MIKKIILLGSTGSIGRQSLEVIKTQSADFQVVALSVYSDIENLYRQVLEFRPQAVAISSENAAQRFQSLISDQKKYLEIEIFSGEQATQKLIENFNCELVINAISGMAGLPSSIKTLEKGINLALANKESIVAAGSQLKQIAKASGSSIIPIDSEHSGVFQCLVGRDLSDVEKVYLTCSGGPFRGKNYHEFANSTVKEALNHPTWSMGKKNSIDSATLVNKGLELIEAHYLFDLPPEKLEILIHPQSLVHALVQFSDGSILAQINSPDMKIPIAYALNWPKIKPNTFTRPSFSDMSLNFSKPDHENFPAIKLAYQAINLGDPYPRLYTESNERAVSKFLQGEIAFGDIIEEIKKIFPSNKP
jgi:1-deoxy-D-xylulose-5-phosphate reductoisomerase